MDKLIEEGTNRCEVVTTTAVSLLWNPRKGEECFKGLFGTSALLITLATAQAALVHTEIQRELKLCQEETRNEN